MKILILALSGIGDGIMFTPALKILSEKHDAQIDVLTMFKACGDIFRNNPKVNNILFFDFLKEGYWRSLKFILGLRNKYDISLNVYPANRFEYNLMNFMIGANKRCGVNYIRQNFRNLGFLNNVRVQEDDSLHNVQENIRLIDKLLNIKTSKIPNLELVLKDDDEINAEQYIQSIKSNNEIIIGYHPGCNTLKNHINRRWEPEKFGKLGEMLCTKFNAKVLVFGGPEENDLKECVVKNANHKNVISVETKSLSQTFSIIKRCNYFVTNDSSLMHAASALGVYIFPVIGPTNINYIKPWQAEFTAITLNLVCAPCFFYSPKPLNCSRTDKKYKCVKDLSSKFAFDIISSKIEKDLIIQ